MTGNRRDRFTDARGYGVAGWEFVHICIDDATRLGYVEVLADEKATTCVGFLKRALRFYRAHGVTVERLMTDNGSAYRSTMHAIACRALGIKHIRTRPYRPCTNGKAERFVRTLLSGWAYGAIYRNSAERAASLSGSLDFYNSRRPHGSLGHRAPDDRLAAQQAGRNNLSVAVQVRAGGPAEPAAYLQRTRPSAHASRTGVTTRQASSASSPLTDRVLSPLSTSSSQAQHNVLRSVHV